MNQKTQEELSAHCETLTRVIRQTNEIAQNEPYIPSEIVMREGINHLSDAIDYFKDAAEYANGWLHDRPLPNQYTAAATTKEQLEKLARKCDVLSPTIAMHLRQIISNIKA